MARVSIEGTLAAPNWLSTTVLASRDPEQLRLELEDVLNQQRHRERWKYTPSKKVVALVKEWQETQRVNQLVSVEHARAIEEAMPPSPLTVNARQTPEAMLALCQGLPLSYLEVEADTEQVIDLPEQDYVPLYVRVQRGAKLSIREASVATTPHARLLWLDIGDSARVEHARANLVGSHLWLSTTVNIGANAHYELNNHSLGSALHRQDLQICCDAPGAHASITSAAFLPPRTHFDQQVTVEHKAPNTSSQQRYHNIADDGAKSTFNGRIHIHNDAPGVDAHLSNKNLALAASATINAKPELEIYTDDVACSHGATIGQIDSDHLFYCTARGIDPVTARQLLCQAFLHETTVGPLAPSSRQQFGELLR